MVSQSYFEDEVRDGFFVPSIMKKCWAYSLSLYKELENYCSSQGGDCIAAYGTMLGAIRHGGYIPWDDDIDVEMLREDFQKVIRACNENSNGIWLQDDFCNQGTVVNAVRSFMRYYEIFTSPEHWDDCYGFPFGNAIDIFIFDYVPKNKEEKDVFNEILKLLWGFYGIVKAKEIEKGDEYNILEDPEFAFRVKKVSDLLGVTFTDKEPISLQMLKAAEAYSGKYRREQCDERAMVVNWSKWNNCIYGEWAYDGYIDVPFENSTVHIPIGYDYILRRIYSDYMTLRPAVSSHGYPYFDQFEKKMQEEWGKGLLRYTFDRDEVLKNKKKDNKVPLSEEMLSSADILSEAHRYICESIERGEATASVLDTLEQCQALAISMGEHIESRAVNPDKIIHLLEKYCDNVYVLYEKIVAGDDVEKVDTAGLRECEDNIKKNMGEGLQEKREAVFLVYKSEHWKSLHTLWEREKGRENTTVIVIPVPYYYRDYKGNFEFVQHLENEGYPEEVNLTSYEEYNFQLHHPDVVYYQFPYDEYSYALSLDPVFYAKNIAKHTEQMVFVPPFLMNDITDEDGRSRYTMRWFLQTPGLVYADKVLVQSEQMKKVYCEILDEFTGHDEGWDWNKRIDADYFPLKEWENRSRTLIKNRDSGELFAKSGQVAEQTIYDTVIGIPETWMSKIKKEDGTCKNIILKNIILYYVSGSVLYEHKEKAINKMRQVLDVAKKHENDIVFLWCTDSYAREILRKRVPSVWTSYRDLIQQAKDSGIMIVEESCNCTNVAQLCDLYYGDAGTLMGECRRLKKPVIWQNTDVPVKEISEGEEIDIFKILF